MSRNNTTELFRVLGQKPNGTLMPDHKVYKTLDGAMKRLASLAEREEWRLMASQGHYRPTEWHIKKLG